MAALPTNLQSIRIMPVELADLARRYNLNRQSGWNLARLMDMVDNWQVTIFDLHPGSELNSFGAPLDGSENDIFVDTRLFWEVPATLHTKLKVTKLSPTALGGLEEDGSAQVCYTSLPFYAVSRSWNDGGNPTLTAVVSVEILIASKSTTFVRVELDDGRDTEVTLEEEGQVIFVNPQQGEVAELVMALARLEGNPINNLSHLKDKSLRHQNVDIQRCLRLFCGCNQYVNTSMRRFLTCADANADDDLRQTLMETVWHYSMPHDLSLWDQEHNMLCFEFQATLLTLANEKGVILQPECGWREDLNDKVSIAEDVSMMWGWQRDPCPETLPSTGTGQHQIREPIGMLPPYCVMKTSKQAVRDILNVGAARVQNFTTGLTGLFNREVRRSISDVWAHHAVSDLDHYLVDGHGNIPPTELPRRLWNVKTGLEAQETSNLVSGTSTTYCAVSYVWDQWKDDTYQGHDEPGNPRLPDLERIRTSLLEVSKYTGIDLFWVDGICINQTDGTDKARELPKMGQYYAGAAFTLVLLPDVNELQKTPTPKPWQVFDAKAHREANKKLVRQYIDCVWLKRIWTVQEAWLARKLVFKTGGAGGELIRGDYLELLRTIGPVIDTHGAVPVCLEWMNIGPTLVMGGCTGDLITPGDTATLLTRPAGSLLQHNDGTGLQARTTTLQRALRLCYGRGCAPKKPSGKLIGLLGMVTGGDELTSAIMVEAAQEAIRSGLSLDSKPEQAFKVAVNMGRLGAEIMLCGAASTEPGFSWLPSLRGRGDGVRLPYIAEKVSKNPPSMRVGLNGAVVQALDAKLTRIVIERRNTFATGQTGFTYTCKVKTASGHKSKAKIHSAAQVTTVTRWSKVPVLLLQRPLQSDPFICVRVRRRGGDHYTRRQGFLLVIENDLELEEECRDGFRDRYIG